MARDMVKRKHFQATEVKSRIDDLLQKLQKLKESSSLRKIKLQDSMEAQKVFKAIFPLETIQSCERGIIFVSILLKNSEGTFCS